jgi:hypothetical protein
VASIMEILARERVTHLVVARQVRGPDAAEQWLLRLEPLRRGIERCSEAGRLRLQWESERYWVFQVD